MEKAMLTLARTASPPYCIIKKGERDKQIALLEIDLETGRYHQIRAQLKAIGSPIIGDYKYGGISWHQTGLALHHHKLVFNHPVTKQELVIVAPIDWALDL